MVMESADGIPSTANEIGDGFAGQWLLIGLSKPTNSLSCSLDFLVVATLFSVVPLLSREKFPESITVLIPLPRAPHGQPQADEKDEERDGE